MAYIYKITNDINGKIYIGKTQFAIEKRFQEHCKDAFRSRMEKRPLYSAMRKYGIEHFSIELVEETDQPEEREKYWIEYYGSFKNGYNATKGGDGKPYIDYDLVVSTYAELQSREETAKRLNISPHSVSYILKIKNVQMKSSAEVVRDKYGKITNMYDIQGNFLRSFPSTGTAATYMVENKLTNCKQTTIKQHITEVCNGKRMTAAKFRWAYGK